MTLIFNVHLYLTDSIVLESCRIASGVFVVRYITQDTHFTTDSGKQFLLRGGDRVVLGSTSQRPRNL